jgi:hypothetical protein
VLCLNNLPSSSLTFCSKSCAPGHVTICIFIQIMMKLGIARIREYSFFFIKYLPVSYCLLLLVSAYKTCVAISSNRDHMKKFKNMILAIFIISNTTWSQDCSMMTNDVKIHKFTGQNTPTMCWPCQSILVRAGLVLHQTLYRHFVRDLPIYIPRKWVKR